MFLAGVGGCLRNGCSTIFRLHLKMQDVKLSRRRFLFAEHVQTFAIAHTVAAGIGRTRHRDNGILRFNSSQNVLSRPPHTCPSRTTQPGESPPPFAWFGPSTAASPAAVLSHLCPFCCFHHTLPFSQCCVPFSSLPGGRRAIRRCAPLNTSFNLPS